MLMIIKWKAGSDWYLPSLYFFCQAALISTEYALNAVNQGVTALGIKGTTSCYQPVNFS